MSSRDSILKERVEHSGLFDFASFYQYAHSWFRDERYGIDEEKYSEKVSGNKKEINIWWRATKALSDYFKLEYVIKFEVRDLVDVEVEMDNEKKKMNQGRISVEIRGVLVKDPESKWDSTPFNRFIRDVYNKYIIPTRIEKVRERIRSDIQRFKEEIKAFLELTARR